MSLKRKGLFLAVAMFLLFLTGCSSLGGEWSPPKAPSLEKAILDDSDTLTDEEKSAISKAINNSKRDDSQPQIGVYVTDEVPNGKTIEEASLETARAWGIGGKDEKNGVLLFVAIEDKELRIEVADGVSEHLTDATSNSIIDTQITPHFKSGNYAQGITAGVEGIRTVVGGNDLPEQTVDAQPHKITLLIIVGVILLIGCLVSVFAPSGDRHRRYGGGYYGGSSSSSSSSSFGGGGGFSGGGASGRW